MKKREDELEKMTQRCKVLNEEFNESLKTLQSAIQETVDLHCDENENGKNYFDCRVTCGGFISKVSFDGYEKEDDQFTRQLKTFLQKQFQFKSVRKFASSDQNKGD